MAMGQVTTDNDYQMMQRMTSKQLRQKALEFLSSKKYASNLVDIISQWDEYNNAACILTLETIFLEVLRRGDMYLQQSPTSSTESEYVKWLRYYYEKIWDKLLLIIETSKLSIQEQALTTSLKLMASEGKYPFEETGKFSYYFPLNRLKSILRKLLSPNCDNTIIISSRFQEITCYTDALYYTWKSLPQLTPKCQPKEIFINNLFELIDKIALPLLSNIIINDNENNMCGSQYECGGFTWDLASVKRSLNKVWSCIIHWELSKVLHEKSLQILLQCIMQHLEKPVLLLNNYLMDSLDYEGPIGLLALRAIYLLVTKHNLEYPLIFKKLYSMFEPEIFHNKQKARLFYLSDIFITSSSHLPESLVAAFIKRLSRLTLVASPNDTLIILLFINNLLLRYPGLKRLIDAAAAGNITDVFLMEECDPLLSNAMFSSLWEIRLLENHTLPNIASAAKLIRDPVSSVAIVEYDMSAVLLNRNNQQIIIDMEIKKVIKDIMLKFQRPNLTME